MSIEELTSTLSSTLKTLFDAVITLPEFNNWQAMELPDKFIFVVCYMFSITLRIYLITGAMCIFVHISEIWRERNGKIKKS